MPFKYVTDKDGQPIMPEVRSHSHFSSTSSSIILSSEMPSEPILTNGLQGMVDLIKKDADKAIDDLF